MNRFAALAGAALSLSLAIPAFAHDMADQDVLERDLTILAHDNMEGREAGKRGYERAAGYVAGRMAALGLEPAGDNGTYFQSVPMLEYDRAESGNTIEIAGQGDLVLFEDVIITGTAQQQSGTIEAELVFVGNALDMPGRDNFEGIDLEGKIAVRAYGAPEGLNTEQAAHMRSSVLQRLSDHGAVGSLLLFTPRLADRYTSWESLVERSLHGGSVTWVGPDGLPYSSAPKVLATGYLSEELSRALLDGEDFDFDDLVAAEEDGEHLPSFALGRMARIAFNSEFAHFSAPNVIGMLPGSDPAYADQYLILTAHLDHVGIQPTEEEGDDEIYNGALDNAVGVASMLEVVRMLGEEPPRRPVLVIGLTAEEKGLIGSSYNAAYPTVPREQIAANVNLDMPVITYDFSDVVPFGAERSNLYPQVLAATEEYGVELVPDPQPEQGFFTRSDQYSYVKAGVPAVYLDLGFGNGGEEEQNKVYENDYHEPSDEIDLIDFPALVRFTSLNFAIARNIANMDDRPMWNRGDFFGTVFGGPMAD